MTTNVTIFHNPRCSKSRRTLQLLQENGVEPTIVEYLREPPSTEQISQLLALLGLTPRELMRTKEAAYRDNRLHASDLDDTALIAAMHEHPILIERPIVVAGDAAVLGRPPEDVLSLLP